MDLIIRESSGWSKTVHILRAITHIGSDPRNEIQLPSATISPFHLQLLYSPELPTTCRVINLGTEIGWLNNRIERPLVSWQTADVQDNDELNLGEYHLEVHLPQSTGIVRRSRWIEAEFRLADTVLRPESMLAGILTLCNAGQRPACQFQVAVDGIPADCLQVDPVPLMYPGAHEEIQVRFYHRSMHPQAGLQEVVLTISAPDDYPGEELVIRQGIFVSPVLKQSLTLLDSLAEKAANGAQPVDEPALPVGSVPTTVRPQATPEALTRIEPTELADPVVQTRPDISQEFVIPSLPVSAGADAPIEARAVQELQPPAPVTVKDTAPVIENEEQPTGQTPNAAGKKPKVRVVGGQMPDFWGED